MVIYAVIDSHYFDYFSYDSLYSVTYDSVVKVVMMNERTKE